MGKELAEGNIYPKIKVKKTEDNVEISYCSMFDDNAFREQSREYTVEECNSYKKELIDKYSELYKSFWEKFLLRSDEYKRSKTKEMYDWDIVSIYEQI